jgi:hypothetical protein
MKYQVLCRGTNEQHVRFLESIADADLAHAHIDFERLVGCRIPDPDMALETFLGGLGERRLHACIRFGPKDDERHIRLGASYVAEGDVERILDFSCSYTPENHDLLKGLFRNAYGHANRWRD